MTKRKYRIITDNEQGFRVEFKESRFARWKMASAEMYPGGQGYNSFRTYSAASDLVERHRHERYMPPGTVVYHDDWKL